MKTPFLPATAILLCIGSVVSAQDFPYGAVSLNEVTMARYERDTSATAVVLKEYGDAFIEGENYHLVFKYHVRIKILKSGGLKEADIEIPYRRDGNRSERVADVRASSFHLEEGQIREQVLSDKNIVFEDFNKNWNVRKFAIPDVRVGSVIEYAYTIESPFIYNFRGWEFQSSIPKMESEYRVTIPGVYQYNLTLRGFQKLNKNESEIIQHCLGSATSAISGGFSANCLRMVFAMKNIPAFVEEDYMTAKTNFLSALRFELAEVRHPDGRVDKVTREWKDAEKELRQESRFGVQLKRGKEIAEEVKKLVDSNGDELAKATRIYDFVRDHYLWNDTYGKYSELGIKKAFDEKKGNVGDINLTLIAALRSAGLTVDPVILSTRANGTVVDLHPVLSEFNYVVAKLTIGEKVYLLDATEKNYPFGMLPERCLNGKGRVIGEKSSEWIDLRPTQTRRVINILSLALQPDGTMRGTLSTTYMGYEAVKKRAEIQSFGSTDEYIKDLRASLGRIQMTSCELSQLDDIVKPLVRKMDVEVAAFDGEQTTEFLFNPFVVDKLKANPFKSKERLYPVDFGVPLEQVTIFTLEYPPGFEVVNIPENVGITIPGDGAMFMFQAESDNNKLSLRTSLAVRKTVFSSNDYHNLKELFGRIVHIQNSDLIFKKKT